MTISIVRLGSPRARGEGLRIGAVRRPPRGVPKSEFASGNWYDTWLPNLSPSPETMKLGQQAKTDKEWAAFKKRYRSEMKRPEARRILELLAAMSHHADFSMGCYCQDEHRCHRSVLRSLLVGAGAKVSGT